MLKMLSTQITGKFLEIMETEQYHIEDAARSLSQAIIGQGTLYWFGFGEMHALIDEVVHGAETLPSSKIFQSDIELHPMDRVVIATRFADHKDAMSLAKNIQESEAQVISLSAIRNDEHSLKQVADIHINTKITEPLLPLENSRACFPSVMTMLYAYYGLVLTTREILADHEEDE
ncbi:DUF2529 family protein [Bacillaceae bacterium S4-13-58]